MHLVKITNNGTATANIPANDVAYFSPVTAIVVTGADGRSVDSVIIGGTRITLQQGTGGANTVSRIELGTLTDGGFFRTILSS